MTDPDEDGAWQAAEGLPACAMQTACALGHIPMFEHIREQANTMARANIARRTEQAGLNKPYRTQG